MANSSKIEQLVWRCIWPSWLEDETAKALTQFEKSPPGAVTLFARHLPDLAQTIELNKLVLLKTNGKTRIAVDEEGGMVRRLPAPFPSFPAALCWSKHNTEPQLVQQAHALLGKLLIHCGFSIDFAPVCDLEFDAEHPALTTRCFSDDPERAGNYVHAAVTGLQLAGINACAKHFPGHGAVKLDSHVELDLLTRTLSEVSAHDWQPFRAAVNAGVRLIMAAHFRWPDLDNKNPTTFSQPLIKLLRTEFKFSGVILTDDLEMGAIANHWNRSEAALLALTAGYDAVLYCKSLESAQAAAEICIQEAESSSAFREMLELSTRRINSLTQVTPEQTLDRKNLEELILHLGPTPFEDKQ